MTESDLLCGVLDAGARLGSYEIIGPLGAGGMGLVFSARDTRLPRTVAIKVLPADRFADPRARQRFEREAAAIAQLSHPRICTLHDIGTDDGRVYLVMEHLSGETLASRLARHVPGGLPWREALTIAADVADALAFAHRQQIVHRDVKPANVMLTESGTKLLDFGIAMLDHHEPSDLVTAPTLTATGGIVGTPAYMAPEQLDGHADARTDLFALGSVLYELLTGRRAFPGGTTADVIAALARCEPEPIATVRPDLPAGVERIVRRCLQKDPGRRWQSAADLADELRWIAESGGATGTVGTTVTASAWPQRALLLASLAALVAGGAGFATGRQSTLAETAAPYIDDLDLPDNTRLWGGQIAWSPASRRVAIATQPVVEDGPPDPRIWIRQVGTAEDWQLVAGAGSEIVRYPFWSPDGQSLALFSAGKLVRITLPSLTAVTLADAPDGRGGAWLDDGTIIYAPGSASDLFAVSAEGGTPRPLVARSGDDLALKFPSPAGPGQFLFLAQLGDGTRGELRLASLDGSRATRVVVATASGATWARDVLYYVRDGVVVAQRMQRDGTLSGDVVRVPATIATGAVANIGGRPFSASDGDLAVEERRPATSRLAWVDRRGESVAALGEPAAYGSGMSLSADGTRLLMSRINNRGSSDVWLTDLETGAARAVTTEANANAPIWAPDGRRFAFRASTGTGGLPTVFEQALDGSPARRMVPGFVTASPAGWSDGGRRFVWTSQDRTSRWTLSAGDPEGEATAIERFDRDVRDARVSPDGRLIAYASWQTGLMEVFVRDLRSPAPALRVSKGGGVSPRWRADGRELYFVAGGSLYASAVTVAPALRAAAPQRLFPVTNEYDVHPDGRRFLVLQPAGPRRDGVRVLQRWTDRLAPAATAGGPSRE